MTSVAALDPGALDWFFFGGILAALVLALLISHSLRHDPRSRGGVARVARRFLVGVTTLWLLFIALAVGMTGMNNGP